MAERQERPSGEILSPTWVDPEPELRLVNGVWLAVRRTARHPSSSLVRSGHKPTTLREKLELEARRREAEASDGDGEDNA